jgi:hypothetical protein
MPRPPLNTAGGKATILRARVPDETLTRIIRLAVRSGRGKSATTRQLIRLGLDVLELAETSSGDHGGPA